MAVADSVDIGPTREGHQEALRPWTEWPSSPNALLFGPQRW